MHGVYNSDGIRDGMRTDAQGVADSGATPHALAVDETVASLPATADHSSSDSCSHEKCQIGGSSTRERLRGESEASLT